MTQRAIDAPALAPRRPADTTVGRLREFLRRLFSVRMARPSFAFIALVFASALLANVIAPYDPIHTDPFNGLQAPTLAHPFGTDQLGRDILSRVIHGSRIALLVGFGAVGFGIMVGIPLGVISGYIRGWLDDLLMRLVDAMIAFPGLILALALVAVRGASTTNIILAIGLANIPWIARITRGQVLAVRETEYVSAARALGAHAPRVMFRHVMPNILAPIIVQSTLAMGYAVLAEASLSFLGLGIPPPTPTWGRDLQFAFNYMQHAAHMPIAPGMAIFLLVLALNMLGDALRDVLDPRLRGAI
jgi:peptide/nickel transport system permease protein